MRGLRRNTGGPAWADIELESLKTELRDRALAVAEREADLDRWEHELDRREARLEHQGESLRRRRLQVVRRLMRLRGRVRAPAAARNGDALYVGQELEGRAAEVRRAAEEAPKPTQPV